MKKALLILFLFSNLYSNDSNSAVKNSKDSNITKKNLLEQIKREEKYAKEREEKYAKEQKFYQGKDYNLSAVEVNPNSLSSIKAIEPEYDFDMDDVYSDIQ